MSDINFSKLTWENLPARTTALSATNLNRIENGINDSVNGVNANAHSIAELNTRIGQIASGTPEPAELVSQMTEHNKIYVYTGSEPNYTAGNWYYYDGTAWTSGGTYGGAVTDTTLSVSGAAADAKAVGDALAEKADTDDVTAIEGDVESLTEDIVDLKNDLSELETGGAVSSAEQLLSDNYTIDQTPYLYRRTNSNGADRAYEEIVGGSVVWNQLCNSSSVAVTSGHKYLLKKSDAWSIGTSTGTAITGLTNGSDMVCDLTQMFGTTIADYIYNLEQSSAGAGVVFFRALFSEDYYAYDAGTMRHVSGVSAKETVEKNLFLSVSKKIALGFRNVDGSITYAAENFTPILPMLIKAGKKVTISANNPIYNIGYVIENLNGAVIARANNNHTSSVTILAYPQDIHLYLWFNNQQEFTIESAIEFIRSYEIQVEIGDKRTAYIGEPHSYPLDSSLTLRGIPKLDSNNQLYYDGDTYASDGTVTRKYGIVDLGTLSWTYEPGANSQFNYFQSRPTPAVLNSTINLLNKKYAVGDVGYASGDDYKMMVTANGNYFRIRDLSYTDAAAFKSAMSGVYLVYELATPTTETAEPFTNPQICDPYGTEEFVSTSLVPVGHYTKYPENLRAKIENLDLSMIAPIETGTTASRAYAVGKYFLLNNKFCKAKTAIASGATFTLNTNYTVTTIADELYTALH